jgi:hypothetical protein
MEDNGKRQPRKLLPDVTLSNLRRVPGREVSYSVLGYDTVWFTDHAIQRMKQRRISEGQVFSVLEHPTAKGLKTQPGRQRWRRNNIDVVFAKWPDKLCIITVISL